MTREEFAAAGFRLDEHPDGSVTATDTLTGDIHVVTPPTKPAAPAEASPTGDSAQPTAPKPKATPDYRLAQQAVESFGSPIAAQAGKIWAYNLDRGWEDRTSAFTDHCSRIKSKNAKGNIFDIAFNRLLIPECPSVMYWERIGGLWEGSWIPYPVQAHHILWSDVQVDLRSAQQVEIGTRIIYGPRMTLPFETLDGSIPVCEEFVKLVEFAFPDPEIRAYAQEVLGQVLLPHKQFRGSIILHGVPFSGKTTLATAVACAPGGMEGISTTSDEFLATSPWGTAGLINKFANVSNDSSISHRWEAWMKQYTSGSIQVEAKYHQPTSVAVTAKLISTCNEHQQILDASGAAAMRMFPFKFTRPLPDESSPTQDERMTTRYWSDPARRAGVAQWLYEGLVRVFSRPKWTAPKAWIEQKQTAVNEANPLESWAREQIRPAPKGFVPTSDLLRAVPATIRDAERTLGPMLTRIHGAHRAQRTIEGKRTWGYAGIEWVADE